MAVFVEINLMKHHLLEVELALTIFFDFLGSDMPWTRELRPW